MLEFRNVSAAFGENRVLERLGFRLEKGEHAAFMGQSGCGKTTLLYLAAGLRAPNSGEVRRESEKIAVVFQEPRLLPWMNAEENVALVLGEDAPRERARAALSRAGLSDAREKLPAELSGGMQQRVSLARALAFDGDLLLLDEPFRGLDEALRAQMTEWIREASAGKTMILITHDPNDAAALCETLYEYREKSFVKKTPD